MSITTPTFAKNKAKKSAPLVLPALPVPQVNLLPPEVYAAQKAGGIKRMAVIAVVVAVVVAGAGYFFATTRQSAAQNRLDDAQAQTRRLTAEQARYAEVPQILAQQETLRAGRSTAFAIDVDWPTYITGALAALPEATSLEEIQATMSTPMTGAVSPVDGLDAAGIGRLTITGRSLTVPDAGMLVATMNSIEGFSEARVQVVELISSADAGVFYRTVMTVQLNAAAMRPDPFSAIRLDINIDLGED